MNDLSTAGQTQTRGGETKTMPARQTLGAIALLLAVIALLAAGWANWQMRTLQQLPERISAERSRLASVNRQVDTLSATIRRQEQQLTELAKTVENGLGTLPDLTARITQSEQLLASLPAMDAGSRADWLKAEALYYLQVANTQAMLAGDPQVAAAALQFADDRLRAAGDPALAAVRAQLAADIIELRALPQIDRAGMSFKLQALAGQISTWSFQNSAPERFTPAGRATDAATEGTAWNRFVTALRKMFSSFVSIKQTNTLPAAQLGAAERALIIESVKAELQLARLALVGNDAELFRQSLQQAETQVRQYFAVQSSAVAAALKTLAEMQTQEVPGSMPDISGALQLMQPANAPVAPAQDGA